MAQRLPLDLSGPASSAIRELVFHVDQAGNDNHWPLWSGVSTSRYRLGAAETQALIAELQKQPVARQQELYQAMRSWTFDHPGDTGMLHFMQDARPLIEQYATTLGHTLGLGDGPDSGAPILNVG